MKKKIVAMLTAMFTFVMPMTAMAAESNVDRVIATDGKECSVQAVATVRESDWNDMGLNVVVSLPITIPLTKAETSYPSGRGNIYMYGVLDEGNKLVISINTEDTENYHVVKYREGEGAEATYTVLDPKYVNWIDSNLSGNAKEGFTRQYGIENLVSHRAMQEIPYNVVLYAEIRGIIPVMGVGDYVTDIPLKISIVPDI